MTIVVVPVTDARGAVTDAQTLAAAESMHRQLRPQLPPDYVKRMRQVVAGGAEMAVALHNGDPAGLAVWRVLEKTLSARELYCDDLVTDEARRSVGVGHALMEHMARIARERGCDLFTLDSGTQRQQAHKFYFREGMAITSFHFSRKP
ncbi:MAG TPA: GNAT family N-acetyltransferase [Usitatibacter sp.]|nr:GNAT family N-acetyltransferase [Usitatibacter sp.]